MSNNEPPRRAQGFRRHCFAALALAFLTIGCQTTPAAKEFPKIASYAIAQTESTSIGAALAPDVKAHGGQSGFRILSTGSGSYKARLGLIEAAEKSLDLQYYSMHDDTTANLLLEALVRAAQRGVRIRLLLDSINVVAVGDTLNVLDGYKNVEIRVYNPFLTRDETNPLGFFKKTLTDLDSTNRRMHNKALICDNQMSIIGGRNLGDEYFEENTDVTFRDIDVLAAGPITAAISKSFDDYWNSKNALPIGQVRTEGRSHEKMLKTRDVLAAHWEEVRATEKGKALLDSKIGERLKDADIAMSWAAAELVADSPTKTDQEPEKAESKPLQRLDHLLGYAKEEFIAVSPYFVPRDDGVQWLKDLVSRGVKVKVITNSLASTDVVAVHTGYRRYREEVVKDGVELYETKAIEGVRPRQRLLGRSAPAHASLHAKVYVIDSKDVMIGSFNLDPRSVELNTEIALLIHSPEVAAAVKKMVADVTMPENSYKVSLNGDGKLVWSGTDKGKAVELTSEPHPGFWRSLEMNAMSLLPIEGDL